MLLHALKNGTTTVLDVGGLRGDWDGYARIVEQVGVRVYGSPPFRDRNTFMDARGRLYYEADAAAGTAGSRRPWASSGSSTAPPRAGSAAC